MSTHLPFPLSDFYDALVAKNVKEKLQPFIAQFRKKNIYVIYQCVNRLIQIIQNKSQLPLMKFNALMAVRYFFDTCEYAAITFIEIYMLPVIYQIALQKYLKRSEQGMELYFVDRGAQNTKQIRRLGLNYVQLAAEFIFNSAKVKPYRLIENRELKQESNFKRTVKVLNNKGIHEQQKCIYYIPSYPIQTRKKFLKKLKHISVEPYISFVISEYLEEINLNKKCDLDIKKLLLYGDSFLTSTMVEIIEEQLCKMQQNFINKKKYLNLLNDLIRSGEIQSIYLVSTNDFIRQIGEQIKKVKGNLGFQQGEYIFPKIQASKQQKKQFYIEFLRVLEIWAYCMPSTDDSEQSDVLRLYDELKQKKFVFPKNVLLKKIKQEMDQNLLLNQQRNETLMHIIDEDERVSQRNNGSYVSAKGEFKFHFPQYKEKQSYIELDEIHYKVYETKNRIARLNLHKQELIDNMKFITEFVEHWDEELEKLDIEDEDPHQLQMLVDEGDLCGEQYKLIKPFFDLYEKKRLTFEQFSQKIQFLQHPQGSSLNKSSSVRANSIFNKKQQSQISIERQMKSSKAQSIRKNIQNQYAVQYGYKDNEQDRKIQVPQKIKEKNYTNQNQKQCYSQSQQGRQRFESQSESNNNNQSKVSSENNLSVNKSSQIHNKSSKLSQSKKSQSFKRAIDLGYSKHQTQKQDNQQLSQNYYQIHEINVISVKKPYHQQESQKQQTSKVSSFQQESESLLSSEKKLSIKSPQKKPIHFKTQKSGSQNTANQIPHSNALKSPSNKKNVQQQYTPTSKKSVIKHSVISKSSYHSQPDEAQMMQSGYNEGNSVMNDYEFENVPQQYVNANLKKSSFKRTQSSAMRNSSHKRIQQSQHNLSISQKKSSHHHLSEAVSPFKKKKESQQSAKDIKIKESYIKEYEFVRVNKQTNKKSVKIKIDDNFTYEDAFRRRYEGKNNEQDHSVVSSESESVLEKRNNKLNKKQVLKQIAQIGLNANKKINTDQSQYYIDDTSILKASKKQVKTTTKKLILFDSNHESPLKQSKSLTRFHEDYEIIEDQYGANNKKVTKLTDKISQMSKNTSKFVNSKSKSSGIKLISRNDHKSFDKLYKNDYGNDIMFGENNNLNLSHDKSSKKYYEERSSQHKNLVSSGSKSPFKTENQRFHNTERLKQSSHKTQHNFDQNIESSAMAQSQHESMYYDHQNINYNYENYRNNMIKRKGQNIDISEINQPQNQPMLYSYCSDKSIHSKLTDSHTRRGNKSSNAHDFKACFINMDKEVLPLTGVKTKIVSNSFSSLDKAFNFIESKGGSNAKSSSKFHSVADAISEKNAKNSILLYKLQRQKTRLVENLQYKIKELQVNGKMMKTKFALKDQSIRENLSSKHFSQPELKLNTKIVKTSRQSTQQNSSMYNNDLRTNEKKRSQQQGIDITNIFDQEKNSNTVLINTKQYDHFFQQYKKHSTKKILHKKKGLFIKNQQIQIGYMINKKDKYLVVSVFITPYASSIKNVKTQVFVDNNIAVKHKQTKIDLIEVKKQQVINTSFYVQKIPYKLPLIKISFDQNRAYTQNIFTIGLPCTIVNFSDMTEPKEQIAKTKSKDSQILRTDIFRCSKKLNKVQKLIQAFPAMKQVKKQKKFTLLQSTMSYQNLTVLLSIALNDNGQAVIYGYEMSNQKNFQYLQYLMATMQLALEEQ